jgi:hypothetical protein
MKEHWRSHSATAWPGCARQISATRYNTAAAAQTGGRGGGPPDGWAAARPGCSSGSLSDERRICRR